MLLGYLTLEIGFLLNTNSTGVLFLRYYFPNKSCVNGTNKMCRVEAGLEPEPFRETFSEFYINLLKYLNNATQPINESNYDLFTLKKIPKG